MHGRTFRALRPGDVVTIWGNSEHRGKRAVVLTKDIAGVIVARLDDGLPAYGKYEDIAMGDNSER